MEKNLYGAVAELDAGKNPLTSGVKVANDLLVTMRGANPRPLHHFKKGVR